jgi:hypothetical protein
MTQKELVERYPKIFTTEQDPRYPIRLFGIECNKGWLPLLDILCGNLQNMTDNNPHLPDRYPQIIATQVKEKFGGLRFYVAGASDVQYGMINLAEELSYHICEHCGIFSPVVLSKSDGGWIYTLCNTCRDNMENTRNKGYSFLWKVKKFMTRSWYRKLKMRQLLKYINKLINETYRRSKNNS